jgi:hypothetical protein
MAVTSQQIIDFLLANPGMSDADIASAMQTYNVTPAMMAQAVGLPVEEVQTRYKEAAPSVYTAENVNKLADQILSQGTTEAWTGGLPPEKAALYMADELAKSGVTDITQVAKGDDGIINSMTGEKLISGYGERTKDNLWSGSYEGKGNTGFGVNFDESGKPVFYTQGASSSTLKDDILKVAAVGALAFGIPGVTEGLLGTLGTTGATALTAAEAAGLGLTAAEASALGLSATEFAAASGAAGTAGLLSTPAVTSAVAPTVAGTTAASTLTPAVASATTIPAAAAATTAASALTPTAASVLAPAAVSALTPTATNIATSLIPSAVKSLFTPTNIGNLVTSGSQTAAGLLQQQTSREAAQRAQQMIDAETAAAKQSAAFRPIGMTTRFGTSQFAVDPVTGQLTSAGYTLSPEAKNAQDRLVKLAESGLQQAEGAQQAFAPLQTGAQTLFGLGNQYLAQNPQDVAQNYLNQQMALLQPGRELELANLQNRLQQQGRGGLSVAQGGTLGATTPELQALFNARAQQEAQLAANAQQAGQQQVAFGAGLLGTGAQTMGQYYGGQQAAYTPYTTALGQVQGLEQMAQQPFGMSTALAQQASQAGANVGRLGLSGAEFSTRLATSPAATTNPYSTVLGGVGSSNALGQFVGGLFSGVPATTAMSAPATTFGTGTYYGDQDLGLYL